MRSEDLVFDKENRLVGIKDANLLSSNNRLDSNTLCGESEPGNRSDFRLPTVEELASLVDLSQLNLARCLLAIH